MMGYRNKIQVICRANGNKQYYIMCPRVIAEALEIEKSEDIEWVIENKYEIRLKRKKKRDI
ncbi:MAG: hypothetical protein AB1765_12440 [Candidatus Hydrogenedentota bacterium]